MRYFALIVLLGLVSITEAKSPRMPKCMQPGESREWMGSRVNYDSKANDVLRLALGEFAMNPAEAKTGQSGRLTGKIVRIVNDDRAFVMFNSMIGTRVDGKGVFADAVVGKRFDENVLFTGYVENDGTRVRTAKVSPKKSSKSRKMFFREWTLASGETVTASFWSSGEGKLYLMPEDFDEKTRPDAYSVTDFAKEDQAHARQILRDRKLAFAYLRKIPSTQWPKEFLGLKSLVNSQSRSRRTTR